MTADEKLDLILQNMSEVKTEIFGVKTEISGIKTEISGMKEEITLLKKKVTAIEITLENETNKNIQIIAEGHFSLNRKLDEAIKGSHDNDIYKLKVNMLDAEIKKIAQRIS